MSPTRRFLQASLIAATLIVGAAAAAVIVSQTAWFKNWLRGYIVRQANGYLNGTMTIGRLGGSLFFGVEMENIAVAMDGSQVVAVKDLGIDYNVFQLIARGLSVDSIRVDHPTIYLRKDGDAWSIGRLIKKQQQEADRSGPGRPFAVDDIQVTDGSVVIDGPVGTSGVSVPSRLDQVDAQLSFKYEPVRYSIEIGRISFRGTAPELSLNALSGGVSVHDDAVHIQKLSVRTAESTLSIDGAVQQYLTKPVFNLTVSSDKLSLPEIARIVPSLEGVRLQPAFGLTVAGALDGLQVDANVRSTAGQAHTHLVVDLLAPRQSVKGRVSVRHIDLAAILNEPARRSDLTADVRIDIAGSGLSDVRSLRGTMDVSTPRIAMAGYAADRVSAAVRLANGRADVNASVEAYGTAATAKGTVTLPQPGAPADYDVSGQLAHADLRKLPRTLKVPPAATDISAAYHVKGRGSNLAADARFAASTVAGARIADGGTVGGSMQDGRIAYRADLSAYDVDLARLGREFGVRALASDRFASRLNAHLAASGRGTDLKTMALDADARVTDSTVLGGRIPSLDAHANLAGGSAHVSADGAFAFDPAAATGRAALEGTVAGSVSVDGAVADVSEPANPGGVSGSVRLQLRPSTVGGLAIDRASVEAGVQDGIVDVRTLEVTGRDLNVSGRGRVALTDTGQSAFTVHADTPSLAEVGKLAGVELTGIAKVDASVTGTRHDLQANGSVVADGVSHGANGALTVKSDYRVSLPDLDAKRATVSATTAATFVKAGGLTINELQATTDYAGQDVRFDVTARQPERSLHAGGHVLLHPDHQEVHLEQLGLQAQNLRWEIAPGAHPAIEYGGGGVTVKDFTLTSGAQRIGAAGSFGRSGDRLEVSLTNVDMADVDRLLMRPPQFTGRLNASATLAGSTAAPRVSARFRVDQGGFRQFRYQDLAGTADYTGRGVTLDARLQQSPTTWIAANGYLPTALFSTPSQGTSASSASDDRIDFHVKSSPIDLALVQGFTTALTDVKGVLDADVDVTGTASDPRPSGAITIQNAAMTVASTGVTYTGLDGRIALEPDGVRIDEIRVLDNQQNPLTVKGRLAFHERQVGHVALVVQADDFKVVDNELGKVRIKSDLRLGGDLQHPRLEGDLGVTTGQIDLDPVLAMTGTSAYATKETEYATGEVPQADDGRREATGGFSGLRMDVHLTVPGDLVVRANDLKAPGASIGLGTVNLTLGGDLRATKMPGRDIRLVGSVKTVRGFYDFQGRRFTIQRDGTVQFVGLRDLNPTLNITAQRTIQGVQANLLVTGTMREPKIELSSVPPLEQADILALIVFNQPLNQLGEGAQISLSRRAEQMATGAVANSLARSVGSALGLDQFEIQMAPDTGSTAQLTIGEQVGQNLYVKVQQGIGDVSTTNFVLEYELTDWLRLQSNLLQGSATQQSLFERQQSSGVDLIFSFSY